MMSSLVFSFFMVALIIYIKKAQAKGLNRDQISANLKNKGWSGDSVVAAFRMVESQPGV